MKVLILTCHTGGGHNAAAKALAGELEERKIPYEIINAMTFASKPKQKFIEGGHAMMYMYFPKLYGAGYSLEERKKNHLMLYFDNAKYAPRLSRYILENGFDTAICVHEFPAFMLTRARKAGKLNIRQYFVATDYSVAPGIEETEMDRWFIPRGFTEEYLQHDILAHDLCETGIPVDSILYHPCSKSEARKELGIREDIPLALIAGGSIGCGPIKKLAKLLRDRYADQVTVVVLCGNNTRLLRDLAEEVDDRLFMPIGFTAKAKMWMMAADVLFTKAGGLTTTEAATIGLPMVFIPAIPGLEKRNLNYFVQHGCGVTARTVEGLCEAAESLMRDPEKVEVMKENQKHLFSENSAHAILDIVEKLSGEK